MTTWLLSITGIIVVGVLVELLLTDSIMSKFIRAIYAFFILLVIVSPLPGLFSGEVAWNNNLQYDWNLITTINQSSIQAAQSRTEQMLAASGIENVLITITTIKNSPSFKIDRVFVNAWSANYTGTSQNINLQSEIIKIVKAVLNVTDNQISLTI